MLPASDIALVLIRHAKCESIQFDKSRLCEMKKVFVAVVKKSRRIDRLEMAERANCFSRFPGCRAEGARSGAPSRATATMILNRNGFDPVNRVLQREEFAQCHHDFMRQHRIRRRSADVEKERAVRF